MLTFLCHWAQAWKQTIFTGTFTRELFTFSSFPPRPAASLSLLNQLLPVVMCRIPAVLISMTTAQPLINITVAGRWGKITKCGLKSNPTTAVDHPDVLSELPFLLI